MKPTGTSCPPRGQDPASWLDALLDRYAIDVPKTMEAFLTQGGPGSLIIFGAGYQGELTLSDLQAMGLAGSVRCFMDNQASKWGQRVGGFPICSPELLKSLPKDTRILIASGAYKPIREQLSQAGFTEAVRVLDTSALRNGLFRRETILQNREVLERLGNRLGDERSKDVLASILAFRLTGDITHVERVREPLHYFPEEVFRLDPDEIFIDGGAFDGDTIRAFLDACGGQFKTIHAFEPDPRNFARLQTWLQNHPLNARIHPHPQALYSGTTELRFDQGPSMSSRIDAVGSIRIQTASLDEFLNGEAATFIKYDLEGAELEALQGAQATIRQWRPKLAISVYHQSQDLWEIPDLIAELTPDYRYFLRHYSFLSFETVLYAIPQEQCL